MDVTFGTVIASQLLPRCHCRCHISLQVIIQEKDVNITYHSGNVILLSHVQAIMLRIHTFWVTVDANITGILNFLFFGVTIYNKAPCVDMENTCGCMIVSTNII